MLTLLEPLEDGTRSPVAHRQRGDGLCTLVRRQAQSRASSSLGVQPHPKISYCSSRTLKRPVAGLYNDPRLLIPGLDDTLHTARSCL